MRTLIFSAVSLAAVFLGTTAFAQDFGNRGDLSFGAERLSGFYFYDEGPADFGAFSIGASPIFGARPYTVTRLGVDYFVIDQLSIGGSLAFWIYSDDDGPGQDNDASGFLLYPRVGYAIPITDSFGFWPRGGFTFWNIEDNDEVALSLEALFFAIPVDHFGISFGPTVDLGMAGDGPEAKVFSLVAGGLFGYL